LIYGNSSVSYPFHRQMKVDEIVFKRPVDVGDLVRLRSRVIYSSDDPLRPTAQVEVICQVVRPEQ
jgi:acyl-CoA hydrolase